MRPRKSAFVKVFIAILLGGMAGENASFTLGKSVSLPHKKLELRISPPPPPGLPADPRRG